MDMSCFQKKASDYEFRFFEPTASHWNDIAACLVSRDMVSQLTQQLSKPLPDVVCEPIEMFHRALGRDHDLLDIANLYFIEDTFRPTPYVKIPEKNLDPSRFQPNVLFVGNSFSMTLTDELIDQGVTNSPTLFFYYNKRRKGKGGLSNLNPPHLDWENEILKYDAIVIEANVARVDQAGFSFPADLLAYLDRTSPTKK